MMITVNESYLLSFLLIFVRVSVLVFLNPLFTPLANIIKVYLSLALAYTLYYYSLASPINVPPSFINLIIDITKEFLFSFVYALIIRFIFEGIFTSGEFIGSSMGLSTATLLNPQFGQSTPFGSFFTYLASVLFIIFNGFEIMYISLSQSLRSFPLGSFDIYDLSPSYIMDLFYESFKLSFKIAFPIIIVGVIINVVLAIVNRLIPQINVFMVGLPFQIFIGLFTVLIFLPVLFILIKIMINDYLNALISFSRH